MIVAPRGFLKGVRRITRQYGVLLIADEVATGFGRTGRMFACEHERVSPDILCLAKGLTGGYLPLAVTTATEEIYRAFLGRFDEMKAFLHGHTYTGNALGCASALANLDIFEKDRTIEKIQPKIKALSKLLRPLAKLAHVGDVRHCGLMVGLELVADKETGARYPAGARVGHRVCMETRKKGLIIRPLGDTIVLMPPLAITEDELEYMVSTVATAVREVTE